MRRIALAFVLALASPFAFAGTPTDAQVDRLLDVMRARVLLDDMYARLEAQQTQAIDAAFADKEMTPAQVAKRDRLHGMMKKRVREDLAWDKLLPMYRRIYVASFDSADVDAMIAFYETPAGQRVIERMPTVMQATMNEIQGLLLPVLAAWQKEIQAVLAEPVAD